MITQNIISNPNAHTMYLRLRCIIKNVQNEHTNTADYDIFNSLSNVQNKH